MGLFSTFLLAAQFREVCPLRVDVLRRRTCHEPVETDHQQIGDVHQLVERNVSLAVLGQRQKGGRDADAFGELDFGVAAGLARRFNTRADPEPVPDLSRISSDGVTATVWRFAAVHESASGPNPKSKHVRSNVCHWEDKRTHSTQSEFFAF